MTIQKGEGAMPEFVVHGIAGSPFVRAVQLVLEEKGADHRLQPMAPQEMRGQAHLQRHPFGRIPILEHGDFVLYETQAILRYVDAVLPEPRLRPTDPRAEARMNQLIGVNDWYFFPKVCAVIGFQRVVGPALMGLIPDETAIAAALPDARTSFAELNRLLGDKPFLVGDELSLADLHLAPSIAFMAATPEGRQLMAGTRLAAWLERMEARPSMQATRPPEIFRPAA